MLNYQRESHVELGFTVVRAPEKRLGYIRMIRDDVNHLQLVGEMVYYWAIWPGWLSYQPTSLLKYQPAI